MLKFIMRNMHKVFTAVTGIIYYTRSSGQSMMVTTDGYVVISDGKSKDALPISMVSQEVIDIVENHLKAWGY